MLVAILYNYKPINTCTFDMNTNLVEQHDQVVSTGNESFKCYQDCLSLPFIEQKKIKNKTVYTLFSTRLSHRMDYEYIKQVTKEINYRSNHSPFD